MGHFSGTFIVALKNSLAASFWYKSELKEYIKCSISDSYLVGRFDWITRQYTKRDLIDAIIESILKNEKTYREDIYSLAQGLVEIVRYPGLERQRDRTKKIANAKKHRDILKKCLIDYRQAMGSRTRNEEYQFYKAEYERREREDEQKKKQTDTLNTLKKKEPEKYYGAILMLTGRITKKQIKAKYLEQMKLYHPDKFEHLDEDFIRLATKKTKEISEAYEYFVKRYKIK